MSGQRVIVGGTGVVAFACGPAEWLAVRGQRRALPGRCPRNSVAGLPVAGLQDDDCGRFMRIGQNAQIPGGEYGRRVLVRVVRYREAFVLPLLYERIVVRDAPCRR